MRWHHQACSALVNVCRQQEASSEARLTSGTGQVCGVVIEGPRGGAGGGGVYKTETAAAQRGCSRISGTKRAHQ